MRSLLPVILFLGTTVASASDSEQDASDRIDAVLEETWVTAGIEPAPLASDEVFLRRIYLDGIGRIPTHAEAVAFLEDREPDKRAKLIDELLEHPGYVDHFYNFWADLLRIHMKEGGGQFRVPPFIKFVRESLAENMPYDEFVSELLTATGDASWGGNPAAGYTWRDFGNPLDHMADTVQRFLGTQIQCAQCHAHPFDEWSQLQFYEMAAFSYGMNPIQQVFPRITRLGEKVTPLASDDEDLRRLKRALFEVTKGMRNDFRVGNQIDNLPKLPHDYCYIDAEPHQEILPAAMFGTHPRVTAETPGKERVRIYAEWMTSPENPRFGKVIVNRLWKKTMGIGLVEPVDEFRHDTDLIHPEVLGILEETLLASEFDLKAVLQTIFNTQTYQREAVPPSETAGATWHFIGPMLRRMTAEQAWDSLVALIRPNPEATNWKSRQPIEIRWVRHVLINDVIHQMSDEEIIEWVRKVADNRRKLEEAGDDNIQGNQYAVVEEWITKPAFQKMADEKTFPELEFPDGSKYRLTLDMFEKGGTPPRLIRLQQEVENRMIDRRLDELGIGDVNWRSRYRTIARVGNYLRASHIGSPAPLGHFLREFGQSDRVLINNSNQAATIPQTLELMNGEITEFIASARSMLGLNLVLVDSPEDKLDIVFLSILNRRPTEQERQLFSEEEDPVGTAIFALLNSSQFLFVE